MGSLPFAGAPRPLPLHPTFWPDPRRTGFHWPCWIHPASLWDPFWELPGACPVLCQGTPQESPRALRPSAGSSPSARGRLSSHLLAPPTILVPEELLPRMEGHPGAFPFGSRLAHSAVRTGPTRPRAGPLPKRGPRSLDFLNNRGIFPKDETTKGLCRPEILKLKGTSWPSAQRDPQAGSIDSQGHWGKPRRGTFRDGSPGAWARPAGQADWA